MGLSQELLEQLTGKLGELAPPANPVPPLREKFPGLMVTRCDIRDMNEEPLYQQVNDYHVYLIDTSEHCWRIVADPQVASGVLVAMKGG